MNMIFDIIENLSESDIRNLYEDIIEGGEQNFTSKTNQYLAGYVVCDSGKRGSSSASGRGWPYSSCNDGTPWYTVGRSARWNGRTNNYNEEVIMVRVCGTPGSSYGYIYITDCRE